MLTAARPGARKNPDTALLNHWFKSALADSTKAHQLRTDWRRLLRSELPLTEDQKQTFASIPAADAQQLQAAIAKVVDLGGTIHLDRPAETGPGRLIVRPNPHRNSTAHARPEFSLGIFHCTFDADFSNWHCHWGPGLVLVNDANVTRLKA